MTTPALTDPDIAVITEVSDIHEAFKIEYTCFKEQTPDAIVQAFSPGWDTADGYAKAVQNLVSSFEDITNDKNNNPTQIFLKASVSDDAGAQRIVGFAIWNQLSVVEGYGNPPLLNAEEALDLQELYPDDTNEQKYVWKLFQNLYRQRHMLMEQQSSAEPPAIMALDICTVHPDFQRRGIASKLVQYGLDEAKRRGGLVCCTEATAMAKSTYTKLGFRQQGSEIEYGVEAAAFARNGMPSYVFMRTQQDKL